MVACQNQYVLRPSGADFLDLLAHRVRGTLVPVCIFDCLFRSPNLHPSAVKIVKAVGAGNVAVQGNRKELRQNRNLKDARIDTIANWYVN